LAGGGESGKSLPASHRGVKEKKTRDLGMVRREQGDGKGTGRTWSLAPTTTEGKAIGKGGKDVAAKRITPCRIRACMEKSKGIQTWQPNAGGNRRNGVSRGGGPPHRNTERGGVKKRENESRANRKGNRSQALKCPLGA